MSSLIVQKYGGTSMATPESFKSVAQRVKTNDDARVIVVSAPGAIKDINDIKKCLPRNPIKVTDGLRDIAKKARSGSPIDADIELLKERFAIIENGLDIEEAKKVSPKIRSLILERLKMLNAKNAKRQDPVAAIGEELNAMLFAAYISAKYLDPRDAGFVIKEDNGKVYVDDSDYANIRLRVQAALDSGQKLVVPGFFGYNLAGDILVLERGGSDYTGSVLAAALGAGLYQNFTDTDGIRVVEPGKSGEPDISANASIIRFMTHREISELTLGGKFGILQYESTVPLAKHGIVTQVLNTFDMASHGTMILPQVGNSERPVTGIVQRGEFIAFELLKYGSANDVGFFRDVMSVFSEVGLSIEHAPSSTNDISIIVSKKNVESTGQSIENLVRLLREKIKSDDIKIHELSAVAMVGEEISRTHGLGARVFSAVASAGVNVPYLQHSGITFTLWLRNGDAQRAAKVIYSEFFE